MSADDNQSIYPCCEKYNKACIHLSTCIEVHTFWNNEIFDPAEDQEIGIGDLVILNTSDNCADDEFFGLVVYKTPRTVTAYTPGHTVNKQPIERTQKVRITPTSSKWRNDLLLDAARNGILIFNDIDKFPLR